MRLRFQPAPPSTPHSYGIILLLKSIKTFRDLFENLLLFRIGLCIIVVAGILLCYALLQYTSHVYTLGCSVVRVGTIRGSYGPLFHVLCAGNMCPDRRVYRKCCCIRAYNSIEGGFHCNTIAYSKSSTYTQRVA